MARRSCLKSHAKGDLNPLLLKDRIMITILFYNCKALSQDLYNHVTEQLPLHQVKCPCGKSGCMIRYGRYQRFVKLLSELLPLSVQRLLCKACKKTHALIPSVLVPYSQITLEEQTAIIYCTENHLSVSAILENNYLIDECHVKYILRQYRKHWKQRLIAIGLTLSVPLTEHCLSRYFRQFMQIRRTRNILFSPPT